MRPLIFVAAVLMLAATAQAVTRPPAVDPNSLGFAVDPNLINFEILAVRQGMVDTTLVFDFQAGIESTAPNIDMTVTATRGTLIRDPNRAKIGNDMVDKYRLIHKRSLAIVDPVDLVVKVRFYDPNGTLLWERSDSRTVLFHFVEPPSPVLFVLGVPWWIPNATAWLQDDTIDEGFRLRTWQKGRAFTGGKVLTEQELNKKLYLAWVQGKVVKPGE